MTLISQSPEWQALEAHRQAQAGTTLRQLFDATQRDGVICFEYETTIYWASLAETSAPSRHHP